jgi:hypothetical protein
MIAANANEAQFSIWNLRPNHFSKSWENKAMFPRTMKRTGFFIIDMLALTITE